MFEKSKNVKRFISISAAAVCMLSALRIAPLNDFDTAVAADTTLTAFEITEEMRIGWNIGNSLDATSASANPGVSSETAWGNPKTTQELIDAVKAKGFNTVRIPTTWYQHLDAENNIDPAWMARVHEVVDYCYKNDMYVILNLHHENWVNRADLGTAYDEMKPKLLKIWQQIADEFTDYDQHLIFECMNEPRAVNTDHEWWGPLQSEVDTINKLNADFVDLIRNDDSPYSDSRLLMIPGYCASSDVSMISKIVVPDDEFVAVSIHAYSPYNFTMNKEVEDHSTFTDAYAIELSTILEGIRSTFIEKDIPVVIGEFSASNYDNTEARCEWADLYISTTKAMGVPCVLWDNDARGNKDKAERHDWIDRNTLQWYEDSVQVIDKMMSVLDDETIVWGGNKEGIQYDHEDIETGTQLLDAPIEIDNALAPDGNCTPGLNATWAQLEGGDVAIKFTGDAPVIAVVDGAWENWTEIKAYDIDDEKGIAYYSSEHIASAWSGEVEEIEHLFARTGGVTAIDAIAIIGATNTDIEPPPEDNTKKFNLNLSERTDSAQVLSLVFKGAAGSTINGCVGYMGEEWVNIEYEGKIGADGTFNVEVPLYGKDAASTEGGIPAGITSAQAQIWWCDDAEGTLDSYEILGQGIPEIKYGDANVDGEINMADAVAIMQSIANPNKYVLSEEGAANADVIGNSDGVTNKDALAIQMYKLELITALPVPADAEI